MITINNIAGGYPLFFSRNGNGNPVLIGAPNVYDILSLEALESHEQVGWKVDAGKMTEMNRPVGIRKSCGDEGSLELRHAVLKIKDGYWVMTNLRLFFSGDQGVEPFKRETALS